MASPFPHRAGTGAVSPAGLSLPFFSHSVVARRYNAGMRATSEYRKARLSRDPRFDGTFFIGVKTTGIFCRPVCPARPPAEANVEYLASAETALQAGFRPCIRCRPDSAPASWAWLGTETTVLRAARLIADNPAQALEALVARLGVGERHLRSLFNRHLGMPPKQFQLCQRLLFAKHLLQDCSLPVEAVARAAGFNSTRSLQQQFRRRLNLTPLQLRRRRQAPGEDIALRLHFRPPYHWPFVREFLRRRALPQLESVTENSYARRFELDGAAGTFTARYQPGKNCFALTVNIDDLQALKPLVNNVRRLLDLDADPLAIAGGLRDAGMAPDSQLPGIRLPGVWSTFEAGCRAICGQQVSVPAAITQVGRLVEHLGRDRHGEYRFPTPPAVAASALDFLGMPQSRRDTLRAFARTMSDPAMACPPSWLAIRGIGPWTVDYIRLRGNGEPDIFLANDLVIRRQLATMDLDPDRAAPWRSYLTLQLWSMA